MEEAKLTEEQIKELEECTQNTFNEAPISELVEDGVVEHEDEEEEK